MIKIMSGRQYRAAISLAAQTGRLTGHSYVLREGVKSSVVSGVAGAAGKFVVGRWKDHKASKQALEMIEASLSE